MIATITRKEIIAGVAKRWRDHYPNLNKQGAEILAQLEALPDGSSRTAVDSIIGNKSWTNLLCDCCAQDVDAVCQVGEEPDYESATALICQPCLYIAIDLMERL